MEADHGEAGLHGQLQDLWGGWREQQLVADGPEQGEITGEPGQADLVDGWIFGVRGEKRELVIGKRNGTLAQGVF